MTSFTPFDPSRRLLIDDADKAAELLATRPESYMTRRWASVVAIHPGTPISVDLLMGTTVIANVYCVSSYAPSINDIVFVHLMDGDPIVSGTLNPGSWTAYNPVWQLPGASRQPAVGNGGLQGHYQWFGNICHLRIVMWAGSTTDFGTFDGSGFNAWTFTLPKAADGSNMVISPPNAIFNEQVIPIKGWSPGPAGAGWAGSAYLFSGGANAIYCFAHHADSSGAITLIGLNGSWGYPAFVWQPNGNLVICGTIETG